ncbi:hypothetical protein CKAN_02229100 [Cinnamomum micranthum f. kanehirae]|uniref:Uncharacterized protein n=1 Tax=Cinnamomum micranthum f. kanehirae TaxID=337451 RepID=A0A3S3NDN8_9MAGN|nr:hypothetical protein CKAN_02229100 [Cinnamomum micranthum f. kanehirae]
MHHELYRRLYLEIIADLLPLISKDDPAREAANFTSQVIIHESPWADWKWYMLPFLIAYFTHSC